MRRGRDEDSATAAHSAVEPIFSDEQKDIFDCAMPPGVECKILRVFAGAGTGKTTTLIEFAKILLKLGHAPITYLTFNRAAVADAKIRFNEPRIDARTLHSQAYALLETRRDVKVVDDDKLGKIIKKVCKSAVDEFLSAMPTDSTAAQRARECAQQRIFFYIQKTLQMNWLHSNKSLAEFTPTAANVVYYPAVAYHSDENSEGFPKTNFHSFYVQQVIFLWELMLGNREFLGVRPFRTHDSIMKQVQLENIKIKCTALLIDESQDMNECQVAWVTAQRSWGTHIVLVGDAVQSIYSFRGAKSKMLMDIPECVDKHLTNSYRFGQEIAAVANILLHCKEMSPQTTYKRSWAPYRLTGCGGSCVVTAKPIVGGRWTEDVVDVHVKEEFSAGTAIAMEMSDAAPMMDISNNSPTLEYPVTVLAFANLDLFVFAIDHLVDTSAIPDGPALRIAINGASGLNQWASLQSKLENFLAVYTGKSCEIPYEPFRGFEGLTWQRVVDTVKQLDLLVFAPVVRLIDQYGPNILEKYKQFEDEVINTHVNCNDADVILSTVHAAKGREWDRVVLVDSSMAELSRFKLRKKPMSHPRDGGSLYDAEMDWKHFGDDYNLWYVAVTRAKKTLQVSPKLMQLIKDMIQIKKIAVAPRVPSFAGFNIASPSCVSHDSSMELETSTAKVQSIVTSPQPSDMFLIGGKQFSYEEVKIIWQSIGNKWMSERQVYGGLTIDHIIIESFGGHGFLVDGDSEYLRKLMKNGV